ERVADERGRALADVGHAQDAAPVVDDEAEAHVAGAENAGAVHREEAARIQRRPKKVCVEAATVRIRNCVGPGLRERERGYRERRQHRPREKYVSHGATSGARDRATPMPCTRQNPYFSRM